MNSGKGGAWVLIEHLGDQLGDMGSGIIVHQDFNTKLRDPGHCEFIEDFDPELGGANLGVIVRQNFRQQLTQGGGWVVVHDDFCGELTDAGPWYSGFQDFCGQLSDAIGHGSTDDLVTDFEGIDIRREPTGSCGRVDGKDITEILVTGADILSGAGGLNGSGFTRLAIWRVPASSLR